MRVLTQAMAAALALATLGGCALHSMSSVRERGAVATFSGKRPAADVAQCIAVSWQTPALVGAELAAYTQPNPEGGLTVYTRDNEYLADVTAAGSGAKVDVFAYRETPTQQQMIAAAATCL
jgi:hypothetical protein